MRHRNQLLAVPLQDGSPAGHCCHAMGDRFAGDLDLAFDDVEPVVWSLTPTRIARRTDGVACLALSLVFASVQVSHLSLIATFWTLPIAKRSAIVEGFRPFTTRRWFFSRTTVYPWLDWMSANAREEAAFDHGGAAMVDFEILATGLAGSLLELGLPESEYLSESSGASVTLLDYSAAQRALARLGSFRLTKADVDRFYNQDRRPQETRCDPQSIIAAHQHLTSWCQAVVPDQLGLWMIG